MSKLIDLTGQKFYELTVIGQAPADKWGRTRWNCICSCGKPVIATGYDLKNGRHKSCGHDRKYNVIDITNQKFGDLTAVSRNSDGTWKCLCSCGKYINARVSDLKSGHTKGCGHSRAFIDLTGKQFGEWTVLRHLDGSYWECQCSCGKISKVHSYELRNGRSLSCGHNTRSKKLEDLTGKQFGDWKVLEYIGGSHSKWKCQCSCGTIREVAAYDLKNGNTRNCGHNRKGPRSPLIGKQFGQLTVTKYLGKGTYECQCSCGNITKSGSYSLITGDRRSCGCQQARSKYTKEYMEAAIARYIRDHGDKPFVADLADELGITAYYVNSLLNKYELKYMINTHFGSKAERDIYMYAQSLVGEGNVKSKDRTALGNGKELDVYIPSKRIAIEFNGNFWHRESAVGADYHANKSKLAAKNRIRLIHIFEYEWKNQDTQEKIKRLIKTTLVGSSRTEQARKCRIEIIDANTERKFFEEYHIQGYASSKVAYGLYNEANELLSVMSFGTPRLNQNYEWEIIRYCNQADVSVIGGAEKLFSFFIKNNNPKSVVSYTKFDKFLGEVYGRLGFKLDKDFLTSPNYVWMFGDTVLTRYQTQRQKLLDAGYGIYGNTEVEIMENLGYERVYDCGNIRYTWNSNSKIDA